MTTIRIPFTVTIGDGGAGPDGQSFAHDSRLYGTFTHTTASKAKSRIRKKIETQVDDALTCRHYAYEIAVVVCGDGTVLTVRYGQTGWGYEIHRPAHTRPSACLGVENFNAAIEAAHQHAVQCYGGVAWESIQGRITK